MKGNTKNALETAVNSISKRRAFGAEITNTGPKRLKADFLSDWRSTEKVNVPMRTKQDNVKIEYDENSMEMQRGQNPRDFDFGPFTPANFPSSRVSENRKARRFQDLEHLASTYRPQYRNQGNILNFWLNFLKQMPSSNAIQGVISLKFRGILLTYNFHTHNSLLHFWS